MQHITPEDSKLVMKKVVQVQLKWYMEPGMMSSLVHCFYVKKGLYDTIMVYNGTWYGLNTSVWAPHFGLPAVIHTLRCLMPGYPQYNLDIGKMFLNFLLKKTMKQMLGWI